MKGASINLIALQPTIIVAFVLLNFNFRVKINKNRVHTLAMGLSIHACIQTYIH